MGWMLIELFAVLLSLQEYRKLQARIEELERLLEEHGINRTSVVTDT